MNNVLKKKACYSFEKDTEAIGKSFQVIKDSGLIVVNVIVEEIITT